VEVRVIYHSLVTLVRVDECVGYQKFRLEGFEQSWFPIDTSLWDTDTYGGPRRVDDHLNGFKVRCWLTG